ncbi:MAG: hypothetical protein ACI9MB_004252, partial [Verrucomicrobiales bacterium]
MAAAAVMSEHWQRAQVLRKIETRMKTQTAKMPID